MGGMATAPKMFRPGWIAKASKLPVHKPKGEASAARPERTSARARGYTTRWDKASKGFLRNNPLCTCCEANGTAQPAQVTDHTVPHRGDNKLFWLRSNWQGLCKWCHDNIKQPLEIAYAKGELDEKLLNLNRVTPGWVHPRKR